MTYILLNEQTQTLSYPPINKDDEGICNYDKSPELLERDGYADVKQSLIDLFNQGKGRIEGDTIVDISGTDEYKAEIATREAERIAALTLTKRIFALALQSLGITYPQLKEVISSNEQAQLEWDLCVALERKNPLLDIMCGQLGITSSQLDRIFIEGNNALAD